MTLEDVKKAALPACRSYGVKRLDVFGSVASGRNLSGSDVDLLVDFEEPDREAAARFFGLLHDIEDALGCPVDLLTANSLRNPFFRERVFRERVAIYE